MLRRPSIWFLAVAVWFGVLFFLSHQSHLTPPGPQFDNRDKVYHAGYFTLGATCFFIGLRLWRPTWRLPVLVTLTVLLCMGVGAFDEIHQSFIPNRSGNDFGDWLADTAGGFIGSLCGAVLLRSRRLRAEKQPCGP